MMQNTLLHLLNFETRERNRWLKIKTKAKWNRTAKFMIFSEFKEQGDGGTQAGGIKEPQLYL